MFRLAPSGTVRPVTCGDTRARSFRQLRVSGRVAAVATRAPRRLVDAGGWLERFTAADGSLAPAGESLVQVQVPVAPGSPSGVGVAGAEPWLTPAGQFYRIDTALAVPRIDRKPLSPATMAK